MSTRLYRAEVCKNDDATLICVPWRDVPVVFLSIECHGGHICNPARRHRTPKHRNVRDVPGLASLTAALLTEGPEGQKPLEWHRRLDRDSVFFSVRASPLYWAARVECLTEDFDNALQHLAECLKHPGLPASEWKRLVREHRATARQHWAQPAYVVGPLSCVQTLGYGHPNAHPASERSFARARYKEACDLGRRAFRRRDGMFGFVGGDVSPEFGFKKLQDLISNLPAGQLGDIDTLGAEEPQVMPSTKRIWVLDAPELDQVFFALSRSGVCSGDPDRVALRLANYTLGGGGLCSRLMTRVRSELGHTYGIQSTLDEDQILSTFTIQSFTQTTNLRSMLDLIANELRAMSDQGMTTEELESAKDHWHGAVPLNLTSPMDILAAVANGLRANLSLDDLEQDWQRIRDTSLDDVNRAMQRMIGDEVFRLAMVGPARMILPQLHKTDDVTVLPFRTLPEQWKDD